MDDSEAAPTRRGWDLRGWKGPFQILTALVVGAYGVHTLLPGSGTGNLWQGWVQNLASTLPAVAVVAAGRRDRSLRTAWLLVASGIVLNTAANLIDTYHDQNMNPVPDPAPSDLPYLLSMGCFIVGVALMTQRAIGRRHASVRLDGAITGLAAASLAGMLWFQSVLHVSGHPLQVVVGMAYPLCDLILIVLLIAGLAPNRYRPDWPTALLMFGVGWFVLGDVIYLNQTAAGTYVQGTPLDETWVLGIFLMGLAAAAPRRPTASSEGGPPGIVAVPLVFATVSLGVVVAAAFVPTHAVVVLLAASALALAIVRMGLTLREVRQSAANHSDARTDSLTGLANRRGFIEEVDRWLAPSRAGPGLVAMALIDLNGFKEVNDALGHGAGDELLCLVAERFRQSLREGGILARLGGDEFAFATPGPDDEAMARIAERLNRSLEAPFSLDGLTVRIGASFGVATSVSEGATTVELLRRADVAMYEAKRCQAPLRLYRPDEDINSRERLVLIDELRDAIDTRGLTLHYQPSYDLQSGRVRGVEALVRWQHPTRGMLFPDEFIPLAERVGLIPALTRAVLEQALAQAAQWRDRHLELQMSVNVSRFDLVDETLAPYVAAQLDRLGLPRSSLTLEITEHSLSDDPDRVARSVGALRASGVRIAIDDFGVGYSSMSQLMVLPFDELKIDRSFVAGLDSDPRAQAIVRSTIELARALDLSVVGEGVETESALDCLRRLGTDTAQGYHLSRPVPPDEMEKLLAAGNSGVPNPELSVTATP